MMVNPKVNIPATLGVAAIELAGKPETILSLENFDLKA